MGDIYQPVNNMKHTTYEFPSGNLPEIEMRHLGRKSECPSAWPWFILGATLGITLYHFFVLPVILN